MMDNLKQLKLASVFVALLTAGSFVVLAVGGTTLDDRVTLVAFAIFIAGIVASLILDGKRRRLAAQIQASKPVVVEMATIASRRVRHSYRMGMRGGSVSSTDIWCLTFATSGHGVVELAVPWDVWERYPDGVRGELRYKGQQFIRFMKR